MSFLGTRSSGSNHRRVDSEAKASITQIKPFWTIFNGDKLGMLLNETETITHVGRYEEEFNLALSS